MQQEYQIKYLRAAMRDLGESRSSISVWPVRIRRRNSSMKFCTPWTCCGHSRILVRCIRIWCWQNESSGRSFAATMYVSTRSLTAKKTVYIYRIVNGKTDYPQLLY